MRNFVRIGEAKSGPVLSSPALLKRSSPETTFGPRPLTLAGMAGETGRAVYWRTGPPAELTPEILARRIGAPVIPKVIHAANAWLDGLPGFTRRSPADVLDLAYVEQRLGCWEATSRYLFPGRQNVFSFMASGLCIEKMLSLPAPTAGLGGCRPTWSLTGGLNCSRFR